MLILTSVDVEGGPFGEAAAEEFARILNLRLARGFAGHGTVMTGHLFAGILGDAENEETEIHQHRVDGLAGQFHTPAPTAGTGKGAGNFAIHLHP